MKIKIIIALLSIFSLTFSQFSSNIDYSNKSNITGLEEKHFIEIKPILNQQSINWTIALEDSGVSYNSSFDVIEFGTAINYTFPVNKSLNMGVSSTLTNWNKETDLYYSSLESGAIDTIIDLPSINFNEYSLSLSFSDFSKEYLAEISGKVLNYSDDIDYYFYSFYGEYNFINNLHKRKNKQQFGINLKYVHYDLVYNSSSLINAEEEYKLFSSYYTFEPIYSVGLKYKSIDKEITYNFSSTYFAFPDSLYRSSTGLNIEIGIDYKLKESSLKFSIDAGTNLGLDLNDVDFVLFNKAIPSFYYGIGASSFLFTKNLFLELKWRYSQTPLLSEEDYLLDVYSPFTVTNHEEILTTNNIYMSFKYFFR